jgi:hypothetical protein
MMQDGPPGIAVVDLAVGLRTTDKVWEVWGDAQIHGWGRSVLAINGARTGNPERAFYHLPAFDYWIIDGAGFAIGGGDGGTPLATPFMPWSFCLQLRTAQPDGKDQTAMRRDFRKMVVGSSGMRDS